MQLLLHLPLSRLLVAQISFVSCTNYPFYPLEQECNQSVVGYHLRRKIENSQALINRAFFLIDIVRVT